MQKIAAEALGKIGDTRAIEPLIAAINTKNWQVFRLAVIALGKIGDALAVAPLIDALSEENRFVRLAIEQALGEIGDPRAIEPLTVCIHDENWEIRQAAADALWRIGGSDLHSESLRVEKVPRDVKIKYFARELHNIARNQKLIGGTSTNFNEQKRNCRAILIGEKVNAIGGMKWMQAVHQEFTKLSDQSRQLEMCWGGIGEWRM